MRFGVVIAGSKKLRESAYLEALVSRRTLDALELCLSFFAILTHKLKISTSDSIRDILTFCVLHTISQHGDCSAFEIGMQAARASLCS